MPIPRGEALVSSIGERPVHHWCGRRVMCDECAMWDWLDCLQHIWCDGGAESLAVAYRPEGVP